MNNEMSKRRFTEELSFETDVAQAAALSAILLSKKERQARGLDELRINNWWSQGYRNWDDAAFKKRMRVSRDTFRFILAQAQGISFLYLSIHVLFSTFWACTNHHLTCPPS